MSIRYVVLNGQTHEISTESLRGLGEWGWDISQDVIANTTARENGVVFNVKDYGATGDGVTDDTAAIQEAIDDLPRGTTDYPYYPAPDISGGGVYFPAGKYIVTDQIIVNGWKGVRLFGASKRGSVIVASAGSGWESKAVIVMQHCRYCSVERLSITTDGEGTSPGDGIYVSSDAASVGHLGPLTGVSTRNSFRDLVIGTQSGTGAFNYGIRCGGDTDANNDFHLLDNVEIGATTAGFKVDNTQSVDHLLINCFILGCVTNVDAGSVTIVGGGFGNASTADFGLGPGQGAGGGFRVYGSTSEGSDRMLITNNSLGAAHNVMIRGMRWSADAMNADGYMIDYRRAGILTVENCRFDSDVASGVAKIVIRSSVYAPGRICNNYWNHNGADMTTSPIELYSYASGVGYPGGVHGVEISGNMYQGAIGPNSGNWRPEFEGARIPPTYAAALPSLGYWFVGQQILHSTPTAGGSVGWVCTTEGYAAPAWQDAHEYTGAGEKATNDSGKTYEVITPGTSAGSGGPTGTGSDITDGTVHWKYVGAESVFKTFGAIAA